MNNMSQVWSEINKVVNVIVPSLDPFAGSKNSDIVNMENYKKCTFIIPTGSTSDDAGKVTVKAGFSSTSCSAVIPFKYRTQISGTVGGTTGSTGSDVPSALTDATTTGFLMTAGKLGGLYIIEVDASTVLAGTTAGAVDYDHVCLTVTEVGSSGVPACVLAILSEPRYPQAILQTAID
ncbi:hypothetical protein ES708_17779 [subsurface metagenome]